MRKVTPAVPEAWVPVVECPSYYDVSTLGEVRSLPRITSDGRRIQGRILKQSPAAGGHLGVCLCVNGVEWKPRVSHLVAEAFLGPIPEGCNVKHLDGDVTNNAVTNLAYQTWSEMQLALPRAIAQRAIDDAVFAQMTQRAATPQALPPEEWRPIPGYEGIYDASNHGRVYSLPRCDNLGRRVRGRILKQHKDRDGRMRVGLWSNNRNHTRQVHQLVAAAFLGPCPEGMEVRHLDGDPENNVLSNLEYATHAVNMADIKTHRPRWATQTHCINDHEFTPENTRIYRGHRICRECDRERRAG